jgi:hypothetical protein
MERIVYLSLSVFVLVLSFNISSCSKDDDNDSSEVLNSYEAALVGSYVSDDDDYEILYLTLNSDRTGSFEMKWGGQSKTKYNLIWSATKTTITETSNGKTNTNQYVLSGKHLICGDVSYQKK